MRCLRMADGLNTMTRRGEIGTSFPVFGLRPTRSPFLRTTNDPNEESFTVSPRSRHSVISFNTSSTSDADSVRDSPSFWYPASHRSPRVTVFPAIAQPHFRRPPIPLNNRRYEQDATGSTVTMRQPWHQSTIIPPQFHQRTRAAAQVKPPPI